MGPVYQSRRPPGATSATAPATAAAAVAAAARSTRRRPTRADLQAPSAARAARPVPDISLNGDWANSPQSVFFNGALVRQRRHQHLGADDGRVLRTAELVRHRTRAASAAAARPPARRSARVATQLYLAGNTGAAQGKKSLYDITSRAARPTRSVRASAASPATTGPAVGARRTCSSSPGRTTTGTCPRRARRRSPCPDRPRPAG